MKSSWKTSARRSGMAVLAVSAAAGVALSMPSSALAVRCGLKMAPPDPYGVSYGSINVPTAPGTYNAYYSFWNAGIVYYARRIRPDGTNAYEVLYSNGGQHDFANTVDVQRRTQMKDNDGRANWSYWVQANSMTSC